MTEFCPDSLVPVDECVGCTGSTRGGAAWLRIAEAETFPTVGTDADPAGRRAPVARPTSSPTPYGPIAALSPHAPEAPADAARGLTRPGAGAEGGV